MKPGTKIKEFSIMLNVKKRFIDSTASRTLEWSWEYGIPWILEKDATGAEVSRWNAQYVESIIWEPEV